MKIKIIIFIGLIIFFKSNADELFIEKSNLKKYKIGNYKNFNGVTQTIDGLKNKKSYKRNEMKVEFYFHRLDSKVFSTFDFKKWWLVDTAKIETSQSKIEWFISPNPVKDILFLHGSYGQYFEIFSIYGNKILEGTTKHPLDVSALNSGFYILKIENAVTKFFKF
ncbi:MAG: T9SS type A sorting domain-containing protein [Candidatus Kapabacteria bacterium]|nr:T9SS type A sorting domain-containing protein [Candidatus Kapabacteria bacterium]